jgi:hypothetical protein
MVPDLYAILYAIILTVNLEFVGKLPVLNLFEYFISAKTTDTVKTAFNTLNILSYRTSIALFMVHC